MTASGAMGPELTLPLPFQPVIRPFAPGAAALLLSLVAINMSH